MTIFKEWVWAYDSFNVLVHNFSNDRTKLLTYDFKNKTGIQSGQGFVDHWFSSRSQDSLKRLDNGLLFYLFKVSNKEISNIFYTDSNALMKSRRPSEQFYRRLLQILYYRLCLVKQFRKCNVWRNPYRVLWSDIC